MLTILAANVKYGCILVMLKYAPIAEIVIKALPISVS